MEKLFAYNERIVHLKKMDNSFRKASIVVIEYPIENESHLVLIKRNEYEGHHSGQMAFPGGKWDEADEDERSTAIREAKEEIGINLAKEDLIFFHKQWVEVSKFIIDCFHVKLNDRPIFILDEKEVNCLFEIPIKEFLNSKNLLLQELMFHDQKIDSPYFLIKNEKIWGATAMIIIKLLNLKTKI